MLFLLSIRNFTHRPWRSALLLFGYGLGVAVMITLLAVGEALLTQARQEKLVGGGEITVLPQGIDVEVMKTGGLGGMFFSIDHARFIYRQVLASPRLAGVVRGVAPQIERKLVYLRDARGHEYPVLASGEIPSRMAAVGVAAPLAAGTWADDSLDRRWRDPTPFELRTELDHFHLPPESVARDSTWAEWHYFNVLSADGRTWAFVSLIVAGRVRGGRWGGEVLVTLNQQGRPARRYVDRVPASAVRFSTTDADVRMGRSNVQLLAAGRYAVHAEAAPERGTGPPVVVDLVVAPEPRAYFPGAALSSLETISGYVVPALRADATGRICTGAACDHYEHAQSYHDHNWGTWRGVTWEWGSARAGQYGLLYGRVQPADSAAATQPLFLYLTDSLGFSALFRPREIRNDNARITYVNGIAVHTPAHALLFDARGDDTLRVDLDIEDAIATDTRKGAERGGAAVATPFFVQMKGRATLTGRVRGVPVHAQGRGFFETYR